MTGLEDTLKTIALERNGVIPVWEAERHGVSADRLHKWATDDPDVDCFGDGVYVWWLEDDRIDWDMLPLERAAAVAGPHAVATGVTVLELRRIGSVEGGPFTFETPDRRDKRPGYRWIINPDMKPADEIIQGIPCRNLTDCFRDAERWLDDDKYEEAVRDAWETGLIDGTERDGLLR